MDSLIDRLLQIPSFHLISKSSVEFKYINNILTHFADTLYISRPSISSTSNIHRSYTIPPRPIILPSYGFRNTNKSKTHNITNTKKRRLDRTDNNDNAHHPNKKRKLNGCDMSIVDKEGINTKVFSVNGNHEEGEEKQRPTLTRKQLTKCTQNKCTENTKPVLSTEGSDSTEPSENKGMIDNEIKSTKSEKQVTVPVQDQNGEKPVKCTDENDKMSNKKHIKNWNYYAIIYWLNRVNNGALSKIEFTNLRMHIFKAKVKGNELCKFNDLALRLIGIVNKSDQELILNVLSDLIVNNNFDNLAAEILKTDDIPYKYVDPITYEIMNDPVVVKSTGNTHERNSVQPYIKKFGIEPISHKKTSINDISPNEQLKSEIDKYCSENIVVKK